MADDATADEKRDEAVPALEVDARRSKEFAVLPNANKGHRSRKGHSHRESTRRGSGSPVGRGLLLVIAAVALFALAVTIGVLVVRVFG